MKRLLSTIAMVAAAFAGPSAFAAEEDWKDDPEHIFHSVRQESCLKAVDGKRDTMTLVVEIIAVKASWDKAVQGKAPDEQTALRKKMLDVGLQILNKDLRDRLADFTKADIEESYDMDREDFARDPYRNSTKRAYNRAQDEVRKQTGVEVLIGVDTYPAFKPGCNL